jgi:hypothetical protein
MSEFEIPQLYAITKKSPISGRQHVLQLLCTPAQWQEIQPWIDKSLTRGARSLQEILPHHAPSEREFIISGTTQEEWDQLWGSGPQEVF